MTSSSDSINLLEYLTEFRETFYLTRSPVYFKRLQLRNSQMELMHRARCGERTRSFHAPSGLTALPTPPRVHQPGSSSNPVLFFLFLLVFLEAS